MPNATSMTRAEAEKIDAWVVEARAAGAIAGEFVASKLGVKSNTARKYISMADRLIRGGQNEKVHVEKEHVDPVELRRAKAEMQRLKKIAAELEGRVIHLEDIRAELMGLGPPAYSVLSPTFKKSKGRRSVILHVSDIQYGEVIDKEAMDGTNSYSAEIANHRIARYFQLVNRLMTELWTGTPADEIVLLLNGDMISGALHHELDRTDAMRPMAAAKIVAEQLAGGISLLLLSGFPVRIIVTPGNHGRTTMKPESKDHALQNYDTLVGWFLEMVYKDSKKVSVTYSKSIDALFSVYSFPFLVTHGDRMGSRGGQGFLGSTATILRGHFKLMADYAERGVHLYKIFTGHFHTNVVTPVGYANGTMAGPSEYSRDGRMRAQPAAQDYFVVHEERGIIEYRQVMVGTGEEGTSHAPVLKYRAAA